MNSNLKLKRDEIQRGKVAVRVNFAALPPLEIAPLRIVLLPVRYPYVFISTIFRWRAGYTES